MSVLNTHTKQQHTFCKNTYKGEKNILNTQNEWLGGREEAGRGSKDKKK